MMENLEYFDLFFNKFFEVCVFDFKYFIYFKSLDLSENNLVMLSVEVLIFFKLLMKLDF